MGAMQQPPPKHQRLAWYSQSLDSVLSDLDTSGAGLSQCQAQARLETHGANRLPQAPRRGALTRFVLQFHNTLIYVLLGSAAITAFLGHWVDTGVILAVVWANAVIGFVQEGKAEKSMDAIRLMLAPRANVIRAGSGQAAGSQKMVCEACLLVGRF